MVERRDGQASKAQTADRFARVRRDHSRETAEDYAEMVLELGGGVHSGVRPSDLARGLGVSHVTVLRALERLARDGIITRGEDQGVLLSAEGLKVGEASRRRHRLVAAFLERLGVPPATAAVDAEGIEHHVSDITLERMTAFLEGNPPLNP